MEISNLQRPVSAAELTPEQLAHSTALSEQQKLAEASRQFEAILLRQILSETQKTVVHSKFSDDSVSSGIYRDMITNQLADSISKSGAFGLASTFERQLSHQAAAGPAAGPTAHTLSPATVPGHQKTQHTKPTPAPERIGATYFMKHL